MKISIITIVLNDKDNLEKTILSIIKQFNNIFDIEYIIIDGGSTDGTIEIIKKYEDKIHYWHSKKDSGISDAFNQGIKKVSGDVIGLVNSGDFLEDNTLETIHNNLKKDIDILYGNVQYWNKDKKDYIFNANHNYLTKFMSINHPAVFVKKDVYDKYGLFDNKYKIAMDYEIMLRFFINNVKFKYIPKVLSNMQLGGVSDINWKKAYKESFEIRKTHLGSSIELYFNYIFQVIKRYISNVLSKLGLEVLKVIYRKNFSKVKKAKDENSF